MIIAPRKTHEELGRNRGENLLLALNSYLDDTLLSAPSKQDKQKWKATNYDKLAGFSSAGNPLGAEIAARQRQAIDDSGRILGPWNLAVITKLTSGMTNPCMLENSIELFRPYGIPFLPSTSIKGIMASWLAEVLSGDLNLKSEQEEQSLRQAGLLTLFGTIRGGEKRDRALRGEINFYDAFPLEWRLIVDITTVHYDDYYSSSGKDICSPDGIENPTPIPFLAVAAGSKFQFCFGHRGENRNPMVAEPERRDVLKVYGIEGGGDTKEFMRTLLVSTATYKGFGSQTGGGYGKMKPA